MNNNKFYDLKDDYIFIPEYLVYLIGNIINHLCCTQN